MKTEDRLLQLLGIATKAGKTRAGAFLTEKAVKTGEACLVLIASDTSERSAHDIRRMCEYYSVPCVVLADKDALGRFTGKAFRSVVAVVDEGLASAILRLYEAM